MIDSHIQTAATVQFLVLSIFLTVNWIKATTINKKNHWVIGFLTCFMWAKSIAMLDYTLSRSFHQQLIEFWPLLDILLLPFLYLYIPAYYFFVKACCDPSFRIRRLDLLHLLPALTFSIAIALNVIFLSETEFLSAIQSKHFFNQSEKMLFFKARNILVLIYLAACIKLIIRYHQQLKGYYSDERVNHLNWLIFLTFGLTVITLWAIINLLLSSFFDLSQSFKITSITIYTTLLFLLANGIAFKSFAHFPLLPLSDDNDYKKKSITNDVALHDWNRVLETMATQRLHLNAGLSLEELAKTLKLSSRYISKLIKSNTNSNFYGFVNSYRVQEAKRRLCECHDTSVLDIAIESGFNSKSTFNAVFKETVGMTPSRFRRNNLPQKAVSPP